MALRYWLGLTIWLLANGLAAQTDTLADDTDALIEDIVISAESEEQVDFSYLTDELEGLLRRPLDLNLATREELLLLPGMTELFVANLLAHRRDFGPLASIYELQAVSGAKLPVIRQFLPYVTVRAADPGQRYSPGPPLSQLLDDLRGDVIQRFIYNPYLARGYTPPDTTLREIFDDEGELERIDTSLSSRYLGPRYGSYTRIRLFSGNNFSAALVGERDRGEPWRWNPQNRFYGYDFLAGHVALRNFGRLRALVVGDYTISSGQGLVLSRGLGFGKGVEVIRAVKGTGRGIQPYASVNENQFMRGAAATIGFGPVEVTLFGSRNYLDASVRSRDTLDDIETISSLRLGGLHRTPSELAGRRAIGETAYGARVQYNQPRFQIGATHFSQQFDAPFTVRQTYYNRYDLQGDQNFLTSVDFDATFGNVNIFGEVARSRSGGIGALGGALASLAPTVDVAVVARSFDRDFHSIRGFVFAERPTALQNEQGVYLGLEVTPSYHWKLRAYFDQFYFPENKFLTAHPSQGHEYLVQLDHRISRRTLVYARFRWEEKQTNSRDYPEGQQSFFLVDTRRLNLRGQFQTTVDRTVTLRSRAEWTRFERPEEPTRYGFLIYQDFIWKPGYNFRLTARYAVFDAPDFGARIYAYENDILGFFSIPAYSGRGSRYYVMGQFKFLRDFDLWLRLAQTRFQEIRGFGSGLESVEGDVRTEIKAQLRYRF